MKTVNFNSLPVSDLKAKDILIKHIEKLEDMLYIALIDNSPNDKLRAIDGEIMDKILYENIW